MCLFSERKKQVREPHSEPKFGMCIPDVTQLHTCTHTPHRQALAMAWMPAESKQKVQRVYKNKPWKAVIFLGANPGPVPKSYWIEPIQMRSFLWDTLSLLPAFAKSRFPQREASRINISAEPGEISWAGEVRLELGVPGQQGLWGPTRWGRGWVRLCACGSPRQCPMALLNWAGPRGADSTRKLGSSCLRAGVGGWVSEGS